MTVNSVIGGFNSLADFFGILLVQLNYSCLQRHSS
jgi:hypothetical protein